MFKNNSCQEKRADSAVRAPILLAPCETLDRYSLNAPPARFNQRRKISSVER
jgi:hypothetical protein